MTQHPHFVICNDITFIKTFILRNIPQSLLCSNLQKKIATLSFDYIFERFKIVLLKLYIETFLNRRQNFWEIKQV